MKKHIIKSTGEIVTADIILSGCYMLATAVLDEYDVPHFYIKVGKTTNLYNRLADYDTHNPHYTVIDFREIAPEAITAEEKMYHILLGRKPQELEWLEVPQPRYKDLVKNGFDSQVFKT